MTQHAGGACAHRAGAQGMPAKMLQTCLAAAYTFLSYEQFQAVRRRARARARAPAR